MDELDNSNESEVTQEESQPIETRDIIERELDKVEQQLEVLEKRGFLEPEAQKIKSQLKLSKVGSNDIAALKQKAIDHPEEIGRAHV